MYQHFLSKCYLEGFTEPITAPGRKPAVWQFDLEKPSKSWHQKSPGNTGGETDYYRFTNLSGEQDDSIEILWQKFEDQFAPAMKRIDTPGYSINKDDQLIFAYFIASLRARVPGEIEKASQFAAVAHQAYLKTKTDLWKQKPEIFDRDKELLKSKTGIDWSGLKAENIDLSQIVVKVPKAYAVTQNIQLINECVRHFMSMTWLVVTATNGHMFVTSDRPVSSKNVDYDGGLFGGGWAADDILITCPLSRNTAVCLGWPGGPIEAIQHGGGEPVRMINLLTCLRASKLLIAPSKDFPGFTDIEEALSARNCATA